MDKERKALRTDFWTEIIIEVHEIFTRWSWWTGLINGLATELTENYICILSSWNVISTVGLLESTS